MAEGWVCVRDGASFNMYGGKISGNKARRGGGVYIAESASFNMTGGIITGNELTNSNIKKYGANIYMIGSESNCTHTGGTINGDFYDENDRYVTVTYKANSGSGEMTPQYIKKNTTTP